ncbi:MAG TPA: isoprenylcysteine carboxylmethyltransferase family protein [Thermoanaerobaculia bacterium]|nr:isoprenylcysteine carboxylmethyltransferase family protein [Thermoanaerobaculia bacterium]
MEFAETLNGLQVARTRMRLLVSRAFGLTILILLSLGSSYWSSAPLIDQALFTLGTFLAVAGFCGRIWCHSYIAGRKKKVLVMDGPYSLCRHPLYFFSLVGGIGLGFCTETVSAALLVAVAFAVYYPQVIRGEETFLSDNFAGYEEYKKRVPLFFPRWSSFVEGDGMVSVCAFRRELVASGGFLLLIGVFELVEALHATDILPTLFRVP